MRYFNDRQAFEKYYSNVSESFTNKSDIIFAIVVKEIAWN